MMAAKMMAALQPSGALRRNVRSQLRTASLAGCGAEQAPGPHERTVVTCIHRVSFSLATLWPPAVQGDVEFPHRFGT